MATNELFQKVLSVTQRKTEGKILETKMCYTLKFALKNYYLRIVKVFKFNNKDTWKMSAIEVLLLTGSLSVEMSLSVGINLKGFVSRTLQKD